jgi:3-oxoacyl-[acyl-carrier-protein] synthase II
MKRVVVTGMGALTPLGNDVASFGNNLFNGKSGAGPITKFDTTLFKTKFACEVKGFTATDFLDKGDVRKTDPFTQYALVAAEQAIKASGLDFSTMNPFDTGVIWGSGQGGLKTR